MRARILYRLTCIGKDCMSANAARTRIALNRWACLATQALLLAAVPPAHASHPAGAAGEPLADHYPSVKFGGFATLAVARSSSDQAEFVRDLSQPGGIGPHWSTKIDSVLGVQGNFHLNPDTQGVVQVISRYGPRGDFRPQLTWAFASFAPAPSLALRAGRIGTDFYMLSDSRWVGYASLTVRPPNDYYGALPFYSIDGLDAAFTRPVGVGVVRAKVFSGLSREEAPLADRLWDLDGSRMTGTSLGYQAGAWHWRADHARIGFNHELPIPELFAGLNSFANNFGITAAAEAARQLAVADTTSRFTAVGLVYDQGPLQAQLMANRTRHESSTFQNSHGAYGIVGYRFGRFTPFIGYSRVRSTAKAVSTGIPSATGDPAFDSAARNINAKVAEVLSDSHSDQHTTTLGIRVDVVSGLAFKAQWDAVRGQPTSIFPYRREQAGWDGRTDVVSFALDAVF